MSDLTQDQSAARAAVMECEQEIQSIKAALRQLSASDTGELNALQVSLIKVQDLPEEVKFKATIQLSSPVEELTLTKSAEDSAEENPSESSMAVFRGVETAVATLTVSIYDVDKVIGVSKEQDLSGLCTINAMDSKDEYETTLTVPVYSKKGEIIDDKEPVCELTLGLVYRPSPKDRREELYELLNRTSQKKATALDDLRKISMAMARSGSDGASTNAPSEKNALTKPSVKPGFLNKKKKEPSKMEVVYQKTFGPNSILRKSLSLMFLGKDYLIFIGAVSFFHFKGQVLSLPPPV